MTKRGTKISAEAYKYDKIYNKRGRLTKRKYKDSFSWRDATEEQKRVWEKYGHSNEGGQYYSKIK